MYIIFSFISFLSQLQLKLKIRNMYEDWMLEGSKNFTPAGNMRAPTMDIYLQWVVDAWDSLPKELIASSFKTCGISNTLNGTEDDLIHCFKPNGQCPEGRNLLELAHMEFELLDTNLAEINLNEINLNEIDLNEDTENGYASDNSI
jgi:hypothetical protein